ncbi:MAG: maleylpyruvate isomerase family mycothiol-dependent enzyme [Nocardioidaceae bacterium]
MDVHARTTANRRLLADFFDGLDEDQLQTRSLCAAWTVREVLGHLVMPLTGSLGGFLLQVVRSRGSINRASEAVAGELARRPVSELTALLRDKADQHGKAPGVGPMGQMADGCVHLRDCARPLGLADDVSIDDWRMVLDWLPSGVPGLVPKRRLEGLALVATDQEWSWGAGKEITGSSEALGMAVSGRAVALNDLGGPGVDLLRDRLGDRG